MGLCKSVTNEKSILRYCLFLGENLMTRKETKWFCKV